MNVMAILTRVFKQGILPNGIIAVKKLLNSHTIDEKMFHQEVMSMMMVMHKNTIRLLGYGRDAGKIALFGVCKQWKSWEPSYWYERMYLLVYTYT